MLESPFQWMVRLPLNSDTYVLFGFVFLKTNFDVLCYLFVILKFILMEFFLLKTLFRVWIKFLIKYSLDIENVRLCLTL